MPYSFFLFVCFFFFFFNDTATTEIYTLSLHDALPIPRQRHRKRRGRRQERQAERLDQLVAAKRQRVEVRHERNHKYAGEDRKQSGERADERSEPPLRLLRYAQRQREQRKQCVKA